MNLKAYKPELIYYPHIYCNNGVRYDGTKKLQQIWIPKKSGVITPSEGFNYDLGAAEPGVNCSGSFGIGIYKIVFNWNDDDVEKYDSLIVEQDAGDNYDLYVTLVDDVFPYGGSTHRRGLIYHFSATAAGLPTTPYSVELLNNYLEMWRPFRFNFNLWSRNRNFGNSNIAIRQRQ